MTIIDETNYVDKAEQAIVRLKNRKQRNGKPENMVTTSKIRNLLAMTADIYNQVINYQDDSLKPEDISRIQYLRVRFIYEAGRDQKVKNFEEEAQLLDLLNEIKSSRRNYILFNRYMEALVAFHRFYGGRDQ